MAERELKGAKEMSNQDLDPRVEGTTTAAVPKAEASTVQTAQNQAALSSAQGKATAAAEASAAAPAADASSAAGAAGASAGVGAYGRAPQAELAQYIDPQGDYFKPWVQSYSHGVPEFVNIKPCENLVELFEQAVRTYENNEAFVNMGSSLTYKQLGSQVHKFAAFLQCELGLKQGDKIAIMLPNLLQFPVAFYGALSAGLTVTNINPLYTPRELQAQLDNSDAVAIVVIANFAQNLAQIVKQTKIQHVIITEVGDCLGGFLDAKRLVVNAVVRYKGLEPKFDHSVFPHEYKWVSALRAGKQHLAHFQKPEIHYDDIALLQYTGGTTGRSKGAMLSHGNIIANISQALGLYSQVLTLGEETILTVIPLYHIFALTINMVLFTHIGGKNLLITDPRNLKSFAQDLHKHPEISCMTGVNTLFNLFITHDEFKDLKWEHLHLVIGGGAAVQSGVEERFYRKTGFHILEGYGLTECSPLCAVCPFDVEGYTGSIGLVVPSTIARIVDAEGHEIRDLEHEGELEIKGPQVMHGYYKSADNQEIFDEGYVRTGDIAKWMPGGYIKLIDRLKDMILVSGFNVFPNEIEDVISRFNRVLECAVVGIPSEHTGEAVKVYAVKRDPALTAQELKQYCRAYLTPYKVPRVIQFVDSLPKSSLGKVLRRKLRELDRKSQLNAEDQLLLLRSEFDPNAADAYEKLAMLKERLAQQKQQQLQQGQTKKPANNTSDAKLQLRAAATADAAQVVSKADAESAAPQKKSAGALALERLMSSKEGLGAAIETPNIHRQMAGSKLGTTEDRERAHLSALKSQEPSATHASSAATIASDKSTQAKKPNA